MTAAITEPEVGLEVIEHLDFEPTLPCEHSGHGKFSWHTGDGELLVSTVGLTCGNCGREGSTKYLLCRSAWDHWWKRGVRCPGCETARPRGELVRLVGS